MMHLHRSLRHRLLLLAGGLLLLSTSSAVGAQSDEGEPHGDLQHERIRVHVEKHCDGDDCAEHEIVLQSGDDDHRVLFIGEDGELQELAGDGYTWVAPEGLEDLVPFDFHFGPGLQGGFLGVQLSELTPELREHFGVPRDEGVLVSKVVDESPAWQAGVRVGDIIAAVDGETVTSGRSLRRLIGDREPGESVALQLYRDGGVESLVATLVERESPSFVFRTGDHDGDAIRIEKSRVIVCDDEGNCTSNGGDDGAFGLHGTHDLSTVCGDGGACEVRVRCEDDGACVCTVDGEEQSCEALGLDG